MESEMDTHNGFLRSMERVSPTCASVGGIPDRSHI